MSMYIFVIISLMAGMDLLKRRVRGEAILIVVEEKSAGGGDTISSDGGCGGLATQWVGVVMG